MALLGCLALTLPKSMAQLRIMPLGDSITEGDRYGGYRGPLWRMLSDQGWDIDFVGRLGGFADAPDDDHEGWSGFSVSELHDIVSYPLESYQPQAVLLMIGTNDMFRPSGPARAVVALDSLLADILDAASNPWVLVSSIPPVVSVGYDDSIVETYNQAVDSLVRKHAAEGRRALFVDSYSNMTADMLGDGVHPDSVGHYRIAETWLQTLVAYEDSILDATPVAPRAAPGVAWTRRSPRGWYDIAGRKAPRDRTSRAARIWCSPANAICGPTLR
jgi:lysophospholipase L1-like esterase